jgi:hypothetical protein
MKYVPPLGANPNDPYIDGNPALGIEGTIVPAKAIEHPQREIVNVISAAGITPNETLTNQLLAAINTLVANAVAEIEFAGIPSGVICMFEGTIADIPAGWALFEEMADKFVIGASVDHSGQAKTTYTGSPTKTGGSYNANTDPYTISTSNLPNFSLSGGISGPSGGGSYVIDGYAAGAPNADNYTPSNTGSIGGNQPISLSYSNEPTYYAVAFIIKI